MALIAWRAWFAMPAILLDNLAGGFFLTVTAVNPRGGGALAEAEKQRAPIHVAIEHGLLTVDLRDAPLADVLQAVAEKASFRLILRGDLSTPVTRSFAGVPLDNGIKRLVGDNSLVLIHALANEGKLLSRVWVRASGRGIVMFEPDPAPDPPVYRDGEVTGELGTIMDNINVGLAAQDAIYRVAKAEYITTSEVEEANTVFAKDIGNKQLGDDFVPFDPRRPWSGSLADPDDDITYAVDQTSDATPPFGGLSGIETTAAIDRAMDTRDYVTCSLLPITLNPDFGIDIGAVAFDLDLGGSPFILADIQHAGWPDIDFSGDTLGVTFTFVFVDDLSGEVTDIDDNGKDDVAFREIYYDPSFSWADDGVSDVDVESVALHEAGHGLSQAHFGKVWIKKNGDLKASPRAVMNALYAEPFRLLVGTDKGGHCSNWANWPNN